MDNLPARSQATDPSVLAELAREINVAFKKSDNYRVTAAIKLAEAKVACKRAGISFKDWTARELKYSYTEAVRLANVGASQNPAAALEDMRARSKASVRKSRIEIAQRRTTLPSRQMPPEEAALAAIDRLQPDTRKNLLRSLATGLLPQGQRADDRHDLVSGEIAEAIAEFRAQVAQDLAEINEELSEDGEPLQNSQHWIVRFMDEPDERIVPLLCRLLDVPTDPWPGLTAEKLSAMLKSRSAQACHQRRCAALRGVFKEQNLTPLMKLRAAANRDWLEGG